MTKLCGYTLELFLLYRYKCTSYPCNKILPEIMVRNIIKHRIAQDMIASIST